MDRCASFGVVRAGSVLLPGLGVVDRWVGHDCFTCVCCCLRPHTIIPLPWRERGIQFPQHKNKHTSQARGDEARKAQGGGERNLHLVFRGRWTIARGPSHTPFGGVRSLASTYRRCGANWAPPYNSYSHSSETHPGEGRNFETSARDERLEDVGGNEGGREWNIVTCWRGARDHDDDVEGLHSLAHVLY